ncbi:pectate lyase [Akkermansiaceae bacterium]|nr:pectate lyase [bacterium]MDB4429414.1 pectate lyase [Akkermansiaceae bacterium]MDB4546723.1 pectate lyase [Akkermansiaceae bacterium]MDB4630330.1 pectate lyase [Akkermansiaceae bacterium]MDC1206416.1 pectate lyase [Akkermansiaceae bacterium]
MMRTSLLVFAAFSLLSGTAFGKAREYLKKKDSWYSGKEAEVIAGNVLSFQSELGGWPKNIDTTKEKYEGDQSKLRPTYDNGATTDELRFLAKMIRATDEDRYRKAFDQGLEYVMKGQYPNGGWPQYIPLSKGYHRHITFNDYAMVRLLEFVREVASSEDYSFVKKDRREEAEKAFERGISCILKCQIKVGDRLTVWCAQHDEVDLRPQVGRSYELASLSGAESVGITRLLMSLDDPSPEVVRSAEAAIRWFEKSKLSGIRVVKVKDAKGPGGENRVVVKDPSAPDLWGRFYDIKTNRPIFVDRDGIPKSSLAEIGYERRNGYAWYGNWPNKVVGKKAKKWRERIAK